MFKFLLDGKKAGHTATPHPKKGGKTPNSDAKTPKSGGGLSCSSCSKYAFNKTRSMYLLLLDGLWLMFLFMLSLLPGHSTLKLDWHNIARPSMVLSEVALNCSLSTNGCNWFSYVVWWVS